MPSFAIVFVLSDIGVGLGLGLDRQSLCTGQQWCLNEAFARA